MKWVVVVDLDQQFLLSQIARCGPRNDCANLPAVFKPASEQTHIGLLLADAEFDSERNLTCIRQLPGAQSVIPAKRGKKIWRIPGVRDEMRRHFPTDLSSSRTDREAIPFGEAQALGPCTGRSKRTQRRQALLLGPTFKMYCFRQSYRFVGCPLSLSIS